MDTQPSRTFRHLCSGPGYAMVFSALFAVLIVGITPDALRAQAKVGTTGAQFLELGVSARSMGMADAFVAVSNDVSAVYYNPAGLTSLLGTEVMATYVDMPAGVDFGYAAVGFPLESVGGVLGIGVSALTSGSIIERTYNRGVDYPNEGIFGTGRKFAWNDLAVSVAYGRYLTDRFSLGFTVRYIGEFVQSYSASSWSADVGTSYNTGYRDFKLAMAITNFGPDLKFIEKAAPLPINFKFGGSINVIEGGNNVLTLVAEGSHPSDNLEKYNAGMEYVFMDRFALRFGGRFNYDVDGFTAGAGVQLPYGDDGLISFNYAYQDFGILTEVHRFTLGFAF
ncbi:MAG: PorV/PorQ family protein [candidate division Zixibacteria bacterium]|nr:PorV/PorQ family protein [candidate division Zixibacteria bacterium]